MCIFCCFKTYIFNLVLVINNEIIGYRNKRNVFRKIYLCIKYC